MDVKANVIEYLVGNKIEIPEKVVTDKVSVENLAKKFNLKSWQVSARGVKNLNELFEDMANAYYDNYFNWYNPSMEYSDVDKLYKRYDVELDRNYRPLILDR